jgi:hypothetical protein
MLTYLLALAVAIASLALYAIGFFFPGLKRENDLIWSGVGLFYALVLWVFAGQVRGGVLLGQMASVALIGWLGWQAFVWRWQGLTPEQKQEAQVLSDFKEKFDTVVNSETASNLSEQVKQVFSKAKTSVGEVVQKAKSSTEAEPPGTPAATTEGKPNLMDSLKTAASGLSTPKNKETYVRKEFQEPVAAEPQPGAEATVPAPKPAATPAAPAPSTESQPDDEAVVAEVTPTETAVTEVADEPSGADQPSPADKTSEADPHQA